MGMPVTVEIVNAPLTALTTVFDYFVEVDNRFSTYKHDSEISRFNRGEISLEDASDDMLEVFALADTTRTDTHGYFDIRTPSGQIDPSGIVKGWAIQRAAELIEKLGYDNYWVDAGGDIQTGGVNSQGKPWRVGIRNPFARDEIIKVIAPQGRGVATSGTYIRGTHIYDPHAAVPVVSPFVSLTVIGRNVYEADRFATAAFAMGARGIDFIERTPELEAYAINSDGLATMTSGLETFIQ